MQDYTPFTVYLELSIKMHININELSLAKVFSLSPLIKEKCKNKTSFEEVAQELMKTLFQTIVTGW